MIIRELPFGGSDVGRTLFIRAMNSSKAIIASAKNAIESFGVGHKGPPIGLSFVLLSDCDWESWESSDIDTEPCDEGPIELGKRREPSTSLLFA